MMIGGDILWGAVMSVTSIERLSPRQLTCISMVAAHISPKQIARELELSENTIRGYLAEAIEILGASDLRGAARLYLQLSESTPQNLGAQNQRVVAEAQSAAMLPAWDDRSEDASFIAKHPTAQFHFLRGERQYNDLNATQRMIWIATLSVVASVLFATSAFALNALVELAIALRG
jgi:DNA-binding CsgD family transcriptional regulator